MLKCLSYVEDWETIEGITFDTNLPTNFGNQVLKPVLSNSSLHFKQGCKEVEQYDLKTLQMN